VENEMKKKKRMVLIENKYKNMVSMCEIEKIEEIVKKRKEIMLHLEKKLIN
jgi:hypothetical protein